MENKYLKVGPSTILNGENGCFAKVDIPCNTIIAKYDGEIVDYDTYPSLSQYKRDRSMKTRKGNYVICEGLPSYINDNVIYEKHEYPTIKLKRYTDKPHNCKFEYSKKEDDEFVYITTIKDIKADEELFINYGEAYWLLRLYKNKLIDYNVRTAMNLRGDIIFLPRDYKVNITEDGFFNFPNNVKV